MNNFFIVPFGLSLLDFAHSEGKCILSELLFKLKIE